MNRSMKTIALLILLLGQSNISMAEGGESGKTVVDSGGESKTGKVSGKTGGLPTDGPSKGDLAKKSRTPEQQKEINDWLNSDDDDVDGDDAEGESDDAQINSKSIIPDKAQKVLGMSADDVANFSTTDQSVELPQPTVVKKTMTDRITDFFQSAQDFFYRATGMKPKVSFADVESSMAETQASVEKNAATAIGDKNLAKKDAAFDKIAKERTLLIKKKVTTQTSFISNRSFVKEQNLPELTEILTDSDELIFQTDSIPDMPVFDGKDVLDYVNYVKDLTEHVTKNPKSFKMAEYLFKKRIEAKDSFLNGYNPEENDQDLIDEAQKVWTDDQVQLKEMYDYQVDSAFVDNLASFVKQDPTLKEAAQKTLNEKKAAIKARMDSDLGSKLIDQYIEGLTAQFENATAEAVTSASAFEGDAAPTTA